MLGKYTFSAFITLVIVEAYPEVVYIRVSVIGSSNMSMYLDEIALDSWGFLKDYRRHQRELVKLADDVYRIICDMKRRAPSIDDCYDIYWKFLNRHSLYKKMVSRKAHLHPIFYEHFAQLLARYVLNKHWTSISSIRCP